MRLTALISLFLLPVVLSTAVAISSAGSPALEVRGGGDGGGGGGASCANYATRDPRTCACLPAFDDPGRSNRECLCPDQQNTYLQIENHGGQREGVCYCSGNWQSYNTNTRRCQCDSGYTPIHSKQGVLTCQRTRTTATKTATWTKTGPGTPSQTSSGVKHKRVLEQAVSRRSFEKRSVEDALGCSVSEKACEASGEWSCVNVSSDLSSCGGCPGEGVDCGALPGVSEVSCHSGYCVIDSCRRGFTLDLTTYDNAPANVTCVPKSYKPWFVSQAGAA
ncbi:hypothetical protein IAT38_003684 [Cryptococcus sp. DSM 104549]